MTKVKFTSPFAPLHLPLSDVVKLEQLADVFVRKNAAQYEHFVRVEQQQVDERAWKLVKQREGVRVYAQRRSDSDALVGGGRVGRGKSVLSRLSSTKDAAAPPPSQTLSSASASLPTMLVVGSVAGTLDDMMYGVVNHTLEAMRVKTSYVDDNISDAAVLATLTVPTPEQPFQSLTIKWMENEQAPVYRPMVRNRDFVYMETTGIAVTPAGERLGYHLLHSVHFPQTHELDARVRGSISVCGIYREHPGDVNEVDVFVTGIVNPGGNILRSIVVSASADALVSAWRNVDCGHMKKLAWLLRTTRRSLSTVSNSTDSSSAVNSARTRGRNSELCASCSKPSASRLRGVLGDGRRRRCHLCWQYLCSRCRVTKVLSHVTAPTSKLRQRGFPFCASCVRSAETTSALVVAQRELVATDTFAVTNELFATNQSEYSLAPVATADSVTSLDPSTISS